MKGWKIVNTQTGETLAEIISNHSMSLYDALELTADRVEKEYDDDPDYIINGKECWQDDIDLAPMDG